MAVYDGDTVRIKATIEDTDGNFLGPTGVSTAVVSLYDTAGNYVFVNKPLTWDPTGTVVVAGQTVTGYWFYDWQDALPGTFESVCTFTGVNFTSFEYGTVRVRPLKVIPTGNPTPIRN